MNGGDALFPLVEIRGLRKSYVRGKQVLEVLHGIDLDIPEGDFVALMGPSGSGKTSFLNIAGLLEEFTDGDYVLDGVNVKGMDDNARSRLRNEKLGFIFQGFNLIPDLSLFDNVDVPLRYRGFNAAERKERIEDALAKVGLASRMKHYPAELSGGQQQRVAIARALCMQPKIMLFDEPTSALDPEMVKEVLDTMVGLALDGMTMVVVSHEMRFARDAADRVVFMESGEVVEQGPPEVLFSPDAHPRVRAFLAEIAH